MNKFSVDSSKLLFVLNNISEYASKKSRGNYTLLLKFALKEIIILMNANVGNIWLFNNLTKKLFLIASYDTNLKERKVKFEFGIEKSIADYVFKTGKIYFSEDLRANQSYTFPDFVLKEKTNFLVCIPLLTKKEKLGILSIYYSRPIKFTKDEIEFFSILGTFLSTFLVSQTMQYHLHKVYMGIATILINMLEEKGESIKGHSERVREIALKIAHKMKLPKDKVQIISDFGILHDIGKIYIDSSILNKPDKLTEEEWEIIKKHPVNGMHIVSPIEEYIGDTSFIGDHHEKVNGYGYPKKIKHYQIPVLARIFSVADAFEAMVSDRPYRKALTLDQVKKELIENAGKQFDEKIVNVILGLINSSELDEFIYNTYDSSAPSNKNNCLDIREVI